MKNNQNRNLPIHFNTEESEQSFITMASSVKTKLRRDIFEYLRNNPGSGSKSIIEDLDYTKGQVMRALKIMKESGIIRTSFDKTSFRYNYYVNVKNCELFMQRFQYLLELHPEPEDLTSLMERKYKSEEFLS